MWHSARYFCLLLLLGAATCQDKSVPGDTSGEKASLVGSSSDVTNPSDTPIDIDITGACRFASSQYCEGVDPGEQRILRCLTSALVGLWDGVIPDTILGLDCVDELMKLKLDLSTSIHKDVYLRKACIDDAKKLCGNENQTSGATIACLRKNRSKATPGCRNELFRVMREASFDFRLDASLQNACAHVVETVCPSIVPGEGRVLTCLHEAAFRTTGQPIDATCKKEIIRQMRQDSGDIRLNFHLHSLCQVEIKTFCKQLKPGDDRILRCLVKHKHDSGFHQKCLSIVNETQRRQQLGYAQNKRLTSNCAEDLKTICSLNETTIPDSTPEEQRDYLHCLIQHRDGLEDACMEEVKVLLAHQFEDLKANPELETACSEEIKKLCAQEKDGSSVINCLINNRRKGLGGECKSQLLQQRIVRNEDIRFHQPLLEACAQDITSFCPKVDPGQGRIMHCLSSYMQDDHMTTSCRKRMNLLYQGTAQDYRLNYGLKKACEKDAQEQCSNSCQTGDTGADCDGKVIACLQKIATDKDKSKISTDCRTELALLTGIQAQDYRNVEGVADACDEDVKKFCLKPEDGSKPVTPGEGRIFKCLHDHIDDLSDTCKDEEMRFKIMAAGKLKEQPTILMMCQDELARLCKTVHPMQGSILRCLITSHRANPLDFGSDCFSVLKEMTQSSLTDYRFNLGVRDKCEGLLVELGCSFDDDTMSSGLGNGRILECLVDKYGTLVEKREDYKKCARELVGLVRMGIDFFQLGSPVTRVCDEDVSNFCDQHTVEPGTCLIQNYSQANNDISEDCQELMKIGFGFNPVDPHSEQLTKKMEEISSKMANLAAATKAPKTIEKKSEDDNQGLIVAVVAVGGAVVVTVCVGVWLIRKYLNKGYVVLKSGDA